MKNRTTRLLVLWNVVLSTVVLVLLGLYASAAQAANDPPVRVFNSPLDHASSAKGGASTTPVTVQSRDKWTLVQKLSVNLSGDHNHECLVIASSSVSDTPGNSTDNKFQFILTLDDPNPSLETATTRAIDFDDGRSVNDHNDMEVTAPILFHATNEPHTFYWFAKKLSENVNPPAKMIAKDNTLSAVCVRHLQP